MLHLNEFDNTLDIFENRQHTIISFGLYCELLLIRFVQHNKRWPYYKIVDASHSIAFRNTFLMRQVALKSHQEES